MSAPKSDEGYVLRPAGYVLFRLLCEGPGLCDDPKSSILAQKQV